MKKFFVMIAIIFAYQYSFSSSNYESLIEMYGSSSEIIKMTPAQIFQVIENSKDLNNLKNQNLIFPGDTLRYRMDDGFIETFIVQKGDTQWSMLSNYFIFYTDKQLRYLAVGLLEAQATIASYSDKNVNQKTLISFPWFAAIGLFIVFLFMLFLHLFLRKYKY